MVYSEEGDKKGDSEVRVGLWLILWGLESHAKDFTLSV